MMNMKQLEALLIELRSEYMVYLTSAKYVERIDEAIRFIQSRRQSAQRRRAHFKLKADEQRELLR